jgi:hypothetical protein
MVLHRNLEAIHASHDETARRLARDIMLQHTFVVTNAEQAELQRRLGTTDQVAIVAWTRFEFELIEAIKEGMRQARKATPQGE